MLGGVPEAVRTNDGKPRANEAAGRRGDELYTSTAVPDADQPRGAGRARELPLGRDHVTTINPSISVAIVEDIVDDPEEKKI
jgi:hypothetical protein